MAYISLTGSLFFVFQGASEVPPEKEWQLALYLRELCTDRRELHHGADVVAVTPQVFDLLDYLIGNRERVVSKDDLIIAVWKGRSVSDAALTTRLNA